MALLGVVHGVVAVDRVGVLGLDPEDARQGLDDAQLMELEEAGHDGRDVARVADGREDAQVVHLPVPPLGDLEGVGLLAQDAPGVLGIEQGHAVVVGQVLHHLHAVVEHAGDLQHGGAVAQGLGQLLGRDLALGQDDHRGDGPAAVCGVERGRGRGVARGSADREHLVPAVLADQRLEVAEGAGHAAVLEGGRGVLPVVLVAEAAADFLLQGVGGHDDGRVSLAQVDDVLGLDHGGEELVEAEHAAQGVGLGGGAGVEEVPPGLGRGLLEGVEVGVLQKQHGAALGAGVEQLVHAVDRVAAQAEVLQGSAIGGKIVGSGHGLLARKGERGRALPALTL